MYAKARRGEIAHFTGIDDPYEEPLHPEIIVETATMNIEQCTRHILAAIETRYPRQTSDQRTVIAAV
jgi:adenylylsulfate kinase